MLSNIFALTAGFAATATAFSGCQGNYFNFYNRNGPAMSYQRIDPILNPGTQAAHLHAFDGGNGLSASSSYDQLQDSTCTTARIKPDKSLYWRPTLTWNGNGTGFWRVPETSTKIYYKFGDGDMWANVTGFPKGFGMIAGTSAKRSDGDNPAGVRWGCHQVDEAQTVWSNGFPKGVTSCPRGFATETTFPSCWNGQMLDPKSPSAHMAYPLGNGKTGVDNCPTTHQAARFPTVFIEFWYDVSSFDGQYGSDDMPWVLSNGDPTGYGFHADFYNGWEEGVLEKATAETGGCYCGCGCGQTDMETCFGADNVNVDGDAEWNKCSATPAFDNNDASKVFDAFPGCNPLQSGPAAATAVTGAACSATAAPTTGNMTSAGAASYSAVTSASEMASQTPMADSYSMSSAMKDDTSAMPSLTMSVPDKQMAPTPMGSMNEAKPTSSATATQEAASYGELPTMSLASTAKPADYTGAPSAGTPSGHEEKCTAPVTVTVTPTVYVTAGSNTTSCGLGTVYRTHKHTVTRMV